MPVSCGNLKVAQDCFIYSEQRFIPATYFLWTCPNLYHCKTVVPAEQIQSVVNVPPPMAL
ncbi:hypothetical protein IQ25_01702 [Novosphingobium taihuense]|uniref:Uncharacterized protein n=1 Tax=Novosphingobium taihuense TaxID=260085 RepID=A0A7W7ADV1_9SPHN|nr:hypothetical protein [Novosphingobium taihuense]TWH86254.1 hypothetical protein IQ25_01702 [Novosphingobium taihuense]